MYLLKTSYPLRTVLDTKDRVKGKMNGAYLEGERMLSELSDKPIFSSLWKARAIQKSTRDA